MYWGDERCVPPTTPTPTSSWPASPSSSEVGAANAVYPMRCEEGPDPYQLRVGELGRLDVVHLGVGVDGHTASLFPDHPASTPTRDASSCSTRTRPARTRISA